MSKSVHVLLVTALFCAGASGCRPADKSASNDNAADQAKAPPASVTLPDSAAAGKAAPPVKAQPPAKATVPAKDKAAPPPPADAAKAAAARADSVRQAEERAEALRKARLDSVRKVETARPVIRPDTTVVRKDVAAPATADLAAQGKAPYEENCRKCHGVAGVPPKAMKTKFPKLAPFDAAFFEKRSSDSVVTILTKGKNEDMKSFKDLLTHGEMVAVAAYIRTFGQK